MATLFFYEFHLTQPFDYAKINKVIFLRVRKEISGEKNIVGGKLLSRRIALGFSQKDLLTQLQLRGIEMSSSSLSKIEGQQRSVRDYELAAFCEILHLNSDELLGIQ